MQPPPVLELLSVYRLPSKTVKSVGISFLSAPAGVRSNARTMACSSNMISSVTPTSNASTRSSRAIEKEYTYLAAENCKLVAAQIMHNPGVYAIRTNETKIANMVEMISGSFAPWLTYALMLQQRLKR